MKVEAIFLSHLHGDHMFGIFGLLSTMAMYGRSQELHIYGPQAFASVLKFFQSFFGDGINYEIVFHPLSMKAPETIHESKNIRVSAFPLDHKIECYGFRFDEVLSPRKAAAGIAPASYAYCSDTKYFPQLAEWVKGVSVLYHEATYPVEYLEKAEQRFHSTTHQAAQVAKDAGVGKLIVGHYSSRVRDCEIFQKECREIFEESYAAQDGDVFEIDYIRK